MSFVDRTRRRAEEVVGDVEEKVGEPTGDDELVAEGHAERAGDPVRDAASGRGATVRKPTS